MQNAFAKPHTKALRDDHDAQSFVLRLVTAGFEERAPAVIIGLELDDGDQPSVPPRSSEPAPRWCPRIHAPA